jgi:hypothetical protein
MLTEYAPSDAPASTDTLRLSQRNGAICNSHSLKLRLNRQTLIFQNTVGHKTSIVRDARCFSFEHALVHQLLDAFISKFISCLAGYS